MRKAPTKRNQGCTLKKKGMMRVSSLQSSKSHLLELHYSVPYLINLHDCEASRPSFPKLSLIGFCIVNWIHAEVYPTF